MDPVRYTEFQTLPDYDKRTDLEKIETQWVKLTGLHSRADWSAAVVRAATATEIAINLAVRKEFAERSQFDAKFIDHLLLWANGLTGKVDKLLLPLLVNTPKHGTVRGLHSLAEKINAKRNAIAHRGEFSSEEQATALITDCQTFVHGIVRLYEPTFTLKERADAVSR
jgi:hypothetical protein